jgi:HlyD family secretion protein
MTNAPRLGITWPHVKLTTNRILTTVIVLAVASALAYAFLPKPVPVDLAQATRGPMMQTVDEDGQTRIRERYIVSSPLAGRLQRITLKAGDVVEAGKTIVAVIEPADPQFLDARAKAEAEARVKTAEATKQRATPILERAKSQDDFAKKELDRIRNLAQTGVLSPQELDSAENVARIATEELRAAEYAVQIAAFELEQARAALWRTRPETSAAPDASRMEIASPIDGRVLRVLQESSTVVQPGTSLLELGDPADLEIVVDVLSTDAVRIKPGARMILEHWGGEQPLTARVRHVEPSAFMKISALGVEEQRVNVIGDFVVPPADRAALGDAYRVEARIVTWETNDAIKVPSGALFRQGTDWAVFVADHHRARLAILTIGRVNSHEAECFGGIEAGTRVILHPSDKIRHGVRIQVR